MINISFFYTLGDVDRDGSRLFCFCDRGGLCRDGSWIIFLILSVSTKYKTLLKMSQTLLSAGKKKKRSIIIFFSFFARIVFLLDSNNIHALISKITMWNCHNSKESYQQPVTCLKKSHSFDCDLIQGGQPESKGPRPPLSTLDPPLTSGTATAVEFIITFIVKFISFRH